MHGAWLGGIDRDMERRCHDPSAAARPSRLRARIGTEAWGASSLFCPACNSPALDRSRHNTAAIDFSSPLCNSTYQTPSPKPPCPRQNPPTTPSPARPGPPPLPRQWPTALARSRMGTPRLRAGL